MVQNKEGKITRTIIILTQFRIGDEDDGSKTEKILFIIVKNG